MMIKKLHHCMIAIGLWGTLFCSFLAGCISPADDSQIFMESLQTPDAAVFPSPSSGEKNEMVSGEDNSQEPPSFTPAITSGAAIASSSPCPSDDDQNGILDQDSNITATPTNAPRPTSTPEWPEVCRPFPDHIIYLFYYSEEGAAVCKGEFVNFIAPIGEGSPWDVYPWDYTTQTGRIAFSRRGEGLWIYDFWTDTTTNWIEDASLKEIRWSPIKNAEGIQQLAALHNDSSLFLISDPDATAWLADDVTHFSWSPDGKKIAYVKGQSLYSISTAGGEGRLLAEGVFGTPMWALEDGVIFIVTAPAKYVEPQQGNTVAPDDPGPKISVRDIPFKVARLDGSGSFIPASFDGGGWYWNSDHILWVPERNVIVGYNFLFELSEDLKTIQNQAFFLCEDMACAFDSILQYSERLPIHWLLLPNEVNEHLGGWGVEFHAIDDSFDPPRASLTGEVESNINGLLRIIVIHPDFGNMGYRMVSINENTQIIDAAGNTIGIEGLKKEMSIDLLARPLSENTLSLLAIRIQIIEGDPD